MGAGLISTPGYDRALGALTERAAKLWAMSAEPAVLIAHAPNAAAEAAALATLLDGLGYRTETAPPRGLARRARTARRVVVLWSREAARAPALRAAARRAAARGALLCVRLDAARPPAALAVGAMPLPRQRAGDVWRRALDAPMPVSAAPGAAGRTSRAAGVSVLLLSIFAVGAALYASDAGIAARVNAWAAQAQTQAAQMLHTLRAREES